MVEKPTLPETTTQPLPDAAAEKDVSLNKAPQPERDGDGTWVNTQGHVASYKADPTATTQSNYLFGRAGEGDRPLWSDSFKGRVAIRLVSRGIVGTAAMALTDIATHKHLTNYEPDKAWGELKAWGKVAKAIDKVVATPIQKAVHTFAKEGHKEQFAYNATRFRPKAYYHSNIGELAGRSLGAEIVAVTAGFSAASLGDATVRNLAQMIDPNSIKSWMVNDKGEPAKPGENKHFVFDKWAKATFQNVWRIVTKNAGEDWAVALPYVYQMRWQRNLISKYYPDSKLTFDNGWNGGSMHYNEQGEIMGDFHKPGAMDLHFRFVGYNVGTLMYREMYDAIGRGVKNWAHDGFKVDLPSNPIAAAADAVGYGARYVVKSAIKAGIYMTPAVIPFWMMRVPQSKWRSGAIMHHSETGNVAMDGRDNAIGLRMRHQDMFADVVREHQMPSGHDATRLNRNERSANLVDGLGRHRYPVGGHMYQMDPLLAGRSPGHDTTMHFANGAGSIQVKNMPFNRPGAIFGHEFTSQKNIGTFSKILNPFGWISYQAGSGLTKLVGNFRPVSRALESELRRAADISMAYTPYMILKAETALRVDERPADGGLGDMDKAIYRFIDSSARFDFGGVKASLGQIWTNAKDVTREVKSREGAYPGGVTPTAVKPSTTVQAGNVKLDGKKVEHAPATNDNQASANDNEHEDRKWAETVAGRDLEGRFQQASHSLH